MKQQKQQVTSFAMNLLADYPDVKTNAFINVYGDGELQICMNAGPLRFSNSYSLQDMREIAATIGEAIKLAEQQLNQEKPAPTGES